MISDDAYDRNNVKKERLLRRNEYAWRDLTRLARGLTYRITKRHSEYRENPDLVQDTLIKAWKSIEGYDPSYSLITWLITIERRTWIDALRRRSKDPQLETYVEEEIEAEAPIEKKEGSTLERAMRLLNAKERELITEKYWGGKTLEQYARENDLPGGTVKSRLSTALRKLRDGLSRECLCDK